MTQHTLLLPLFYTISFYGTRTLYESYTRTMPTTTAVSRQPKGPNDRRLVNFGSTCPEIIVVPPSPQKRKLSYCPINYPRLGSTFSFRAKASVSRVSVRVSVCDEIWIANRASKIISSTFLIISYVTHTSKTPIRLNQTDQSCPRAWPSEFLSSDRTNAWSTLRKDRLNKGFPIEWVS